MTGGLEGVIKRNITTIQLNERIFQKSLKARLIIAPVYTTAVQKKNALYASYVKNDFSS